MGGYGFNRRGGQISDSESDRISDNLDWEKIHPNSIRTLNMFRSEIISDPDQIRMSLNFILYFKFGLYFGSGLIRIWDLFTILTKKL